MATFMKAIQITNVGDVDVLNYDNVERPKITEQNDVLIRNSFIGVNYIDIYHRTGVYQLPLPAILGREGAGVVEAVGEGVEDIHPGDHVAYIKASTYAEYAKAPAEFVTKIPEGLDMKLAAASLIQGLTSWTMVTESYAVKKGDWILIHAAAGGCGLILTQLVKNLGAHAIGTVSTPEKAELAKAAGAEYVINYTNEDVVERVMQITENNGAHAVYDGVGKETFETSLACARRLGSIISFGNASGIVPPFNILRLSEKNLRLMRPSLFSYLTTKEEFQRYSKELFSILAEGKLDIKIWKVYKLSDAKLAHQDLEGRKTCGKLLLQP